MCWRVSAVGNKDDIPDRKVVLSQDAQKFAADSGITLFETSAKEGVNVEEVCLDFVLCVAFHFMLSVTELSSLTL